MAEPENGTKAASVLRADLFKVATLIIAALAIAATLTFRYAGDSARTERILTLIESLQNTDRSLLEWREEADRRLGIVEVKLAGMEASHDTVETRLRLLEMRAIQLNQRLSKQEDD